MKPLTTTPREDEALTPGWARGGRLRSRLAAGTAAAVALLGLAAAPARSDGYGEYQVKAAFLMNFARYTEWPDGTFADEVAPIVIGVLGEDPFGSDLLALQGKSIGERPIAVRHYTDPDDVDCHVLFVSASERARLAPTLELLAPLPVVTVSDLPGFIEQGGTVRFVQVGDNIRFEINHGAAQAAGLRISSHLLRLAISVKRKA